MEENNLIGKLTLTCSFIPYSRRSRYLLSSGEINYFLHPGARTPVYEMLSGWCAIRSRHKTQPCNDKCHFNNSSHFVVLGGALSLDPSLPIFFFYWSDVVDYKLIFSDKTWHDLRLGLIRKEYSCVPDVCFWPMKWEWQLRLVTILIILYHAIFEFPYSIAKLEPNNRSAVPRRRGAWYSSRSICWLDLSH